MNTSLVAQYKGAMAGISNEGDAGTDLFIVGDHTLGPWEKKLIGTGVRVALPQHTVGLLAPRSSSGKINIILANTLGILDCTYRGEVKLFIRNLHPIEPLHLKDNQSVAQLIIIPFITPIWQKVEELPPSRRGANGFGSTESQGREVDLSGVFPNKIEYIAGTCIQCLLLTHECTCGALHK